MGSKGLSQRMREYRNLYRKANNGDVAAANSLYAANDRLATETNRILRELERKGFDYGAAYNNLTFYTQTQYDGKRLQKSKALEHDLYNVYRQIEEITKFQSYKASTVAGQQDILKNKIEAFESTGILPKNFSARSKKQFIRFLANEETREIVETYGDSEKSIRMLRDAYFSRKNTIAAMKREIAQFLANDKNGAKTFDELMGRLNVDVYSEKYQRQQSAKNYFLNE